MSKRSRVPPPRVTHGLRESISARRTAFNSIFNVDRGQDLLGAASDDVMKEHT